MRRLPALVVLLGAFAARAFQGENGAHPDIARLEAGLHPYAGHVTCAAGPTVEGIDVSHWDGAIDWAKVAGSGRKFGIAKATEGVNYVDPTYAGHWAAMKHAGVVRGAYHFFRPADSGLQQADWYLSTVGALAPGDLPPVLDWEAIDGIASAAAIKEVQAFVDRIHSRTGLTTLVYTSERVMGELGHPVQFSGLPLWDANWGVSCPNIPSAWPAWTFWQYSATGAVPGITGDVDLNVYNGTAAQLGAITVPAPGDGGPLDGGAADAGPLDGGAADAGPPGLDAGAPDGSTGGSADGGELPGANLAQTGCSASGSGSALAALFLLAAACGRRRRSRRLNR